VLICFEAEDFAVTGIHRINFEGKLALQQIRNYAATHGSRTIRGSDHRRRARPKQGIESRLGRWRCVELADR